MNRTLDYYNHSPTHNQRFTSLKKLLSVLLGKVYATRSVREKMRHPVLKTPEVRFPPTNLEAKIWDLLMAC